MSKENSKAEELRKELFYEPKHAAEIISAAEVKKADKFCEDYKAFLNASKTEREAVKYIVAKAQKLGYVPFDRDKKYKAGDKVYYNYVLH